MSRVEFFGRWREEKRIDDRIHERVSNASKNRRRGLNDFTNKLFREKKEKKRRRKKHRKRGDMRKKRKPVKGKRRIVRDELLHEVNVVLHFFWDKKLTNSSWLGGRRILKFSQIWHTRLVVVNQFHGISSLES
jgi:hypothetical protein